MFFLSRVHFYSLQSILLPCLRCLISLYPRTYIQFDWHENQEKEGGNKGGGSESAHINPPFTVPTFGEYRRPARTTRLDVGRQGQVSGSLELILVHRIYGHETALDMVADVAQDTVPEHLDFPRDVYETGGKAVSWCIA